MMTPKQERNGVPGPAATRNTAEAAAGPDLTAAIAAKLGSVTSPVSPTTVKGPTTIGEA